MTDSYHTRPNLTQVDSTNSNSNSNTQNSQLRLETHREAVRTGRLHFNVEDGLVQQQHHQEHSQVPLAVHPQPTPAAVHLSHQHLFDVHHFCFIVVVDVDVVVATAAAAAVAATAAALRPRQRTAAAAAATAARPGAVEEQLSATLRPGFVSSFGGLQLEREHLVCLGVLELER